MGAYGVAVNRNKKRRPTKRIVGRRFAVGNAAQPVQRPVISEPSTFSLRAFGPRVTATAPERTSSMMP